MNRGAWWTTVHGCNESDMTEQLGTAAVVTYLYICVFPLDRELLKGSSCFLHLDTDEEMSDRGNENKIVTHVNQMQRSKVTV